MSLAQYKCRYYNTVLPGAGTSPIALTKPPHEHAGFEGGLSAVEMSSGRIVQIETKATAYDASQFFRIPSIIKTKRGTIIASYDIRWDNSNDIGMTTTYHQCTGTSRSTDGGRTWENPICTTVWLYSDGISAQSGVSDPALAYDEENDCVFQFSIGGRGLIGNLLSDKDAELTSANRQQMVMSYSTDDGKTWSEGEAILSAISNAQEKLVGKYAYLFPGCSRSIILKHQTGQYASKNGAIVFPIQMWTGGVSTKNNAVAGLLEISPTYTTQADGSVKATMHGTILDGVIGHDPDGSNVIGASECAVCEDNTGRLVMVVKSYYNTKFNFADYPTCSQAQSYTKIFQSTDCGNSWSVVGDKIVAGNTNAAACSTLRNTQACKASICYSDTTKKFYISYQQSTSRLCPVIRSSSDLINWDMFDATTLLPSGYSDVMSPDGNTLYYIGEISENQQFNFVEYELAVKKRLTTYTNGWSELVTNSDTKQIITGEYIESRVADNDATGISAIVFKPTAFTEKDQFVLSNFQIMTHSTIEGPASRVQFQLVTQDANEKLKLHTSSVDDSSITINYTLDEEPTLEHDRDIDLSEVPVAECSAECDTEYITPSLPVLAQNLTFKAGAGEQYTIIGETLESADMSQKGVFVNFTMAQPVTLSPQTEYRLVAKRVDEADPYKGGVSLRLISNALPEYHVSQFTAYAPCMNINYESRYNTYKRNVQGFDFMIDAVTDRSYLNVKTVSFDTGSADFNNTFLMLYTAKTTDDTTEYELVVQNGKEAVSNVTQAKANSIVKYAFDHTVKLSTGIKYYAVICSGQRRSPADYGAVGNYASMSFSESENSENTTIDTHYGDGSKSVLVPNGIFGAGRLVPHIYLEENRMTSTDGKIAVLVSSITGKPAVMISKTGKPALLLRGKENQA